MSKNAAIVSLTAAAAILVACAGGHVNQSATPSPTCTNQATAEAVSSVNRTYLAATPSASRPAGVLNLPDDELTCQIRRLAIDQGDVPINWQYHRVPTIGDAGDLCGKSATRPLGGAVSQFADPSSGGATVREQLGVFAPGQARQYVAGIKTACAKDAASPNLGLPPIQGHVPVVQAARGDESMAFSASVADIIEYDFVVRYGDVVSTLVYVEAGARLSDAELFEQTADARLLRLLSSFKTQAKVN